MNISLKRQTPWGCMRHFVIYKNGIKQGKLFNNIVTEIEVEDGDVLSFKEGYFYFSKTIKIESETKEVVIVNNNHIKQLFSLFIILFLAISLLTFSITSLKGFISTEIASFYILNLLFRYYSYSFKLEPSDSLNSVPRVEIS
ncbi:hypothetical protein [Candidatus Enterococcus ikei]|uniref:Uncharacterized protein n=1 Tax=Candidatus Enterococcus ikei TaxID=2815326 RepID=A0ABS3H0L8_9ENTE|nr:hypothetical protein [Enterococcus sp. DIV0869a]MBO0440244.1 hypothetical protein [Enterococcus sp. DIV0869a]